MQILITGGAGFIGSNLAMLFREALPKARIVVLDNLKRRGSELNLPRLKANGIEFVHGDIRQPSDLDDLTGNFDLFIEASAEPSVLSGMQGDSPQYSVQTNLVGTTHCLEFARKRSGTMLFLSTSRVYSIPGLLDLPLIKTDSRFELDHTKVEGVRSGLSAKGISENFSVAGFRSIYGSTKLASELLIEEYVNAYGVKAVINRCSVLSGPWQMGKVDQGVFTLWMARHVYGGKLSYTGFDGTGFQVRDLLHPRDLFDLVTRQVAQMNGWKGQVYNVGGGHSNSTSLFELTGLCQELTGRKIEIGLTPKTSAVDIPFYVTDSSLAKTTFGWQPRASVRELMDELRQWLVERETELKPLFT